ncbi:MAG: CheR family methyltransferase [Bacillota bacterium]
MTQFTEHNFHKFRDLVYEKLGIVFSDAKKIVLESKINKMMNNTGICNYEEYYRLITSNGVFWKDFVDEITVNKTEFFRENNHFDFIHREIFYIARKNPRIVKNKEIRAWSAGCSTGEEAFSLAMCFMETVPEAYNIKILATDINHSVIKKAQTGRYLISAESVPSYYLHKYFQKYSDHEYIISPVIRKLIVFRHFNLTDDFPFENKMDIIFCRNVMIYFDTQIQQQLFQKFYDILVPGGLLFLGHSEGILDKNLGFRYVQPTIYLRD